MQNFFKKSLFALTILFTLYIFPETQAPNGNFPVGTQKSALPSVADVFGGLSEQEIAEQVQMGQQFLEDLQKHGTPQEIAEFQKLLEETLNSMSEEDFKDIQAIAQMVEPHLVSPQPESSTSASNSSSIIDTSIPAATELEEFKKLISTIIQRIDDIFQKINSSKDCAEQVDSKWKNKSTFANMKRQIYQLKNDRLAQKLCKKDVKDDDKKLVDQLKKYLKDLTIQNDAFVIEDDFGLPASFVEEKKHLKQTKAFLETCDEIIDTLMPLLENFLQKWDPEALQLAKESESRTQKAAKDATDATKRQASTNAQPKSSTGSSGYGYNDYYYPSGSNYGSDYSGYSPEAYDRYNSYNSPEFDFGSKESGADSSSSADKNLKPKSTDIDAKTLQAKDSKNKSDLYDYAISELDGHMKDDFDSKHEASFVNFIENDIVKKYPIYNAGNGEYSATLPSASPTAASVDYNTTNSSQPQENSWIDGTSPFPIKLTSGVIVNGFKNYTSEIKSKLEDEFYPEFRQLHPYIDALRSDVTNMTSEDLKKLQNSSELKAVENRLKKYKKAFDDALPKLNDAFQYNTIPGTANAPAKQPGILDASTLPRYQNAHDDFVSELQAKIGKEVDTMLGTINTIRRSSKRLATKKSSQQPVLATTSA